MKTMTINCFNESTMMTWKDIIREDDTVSTFSVVRNDEETRGLDGEYTITVSFK